MADYIYKPPKQAENIRLMISRGVPQRIFGVSPFNIEKTISSFSVKVGKEEYIERSKTDQLSDIKSIVQDPFQFPLTVIGARAFVNKAQALASWVFRHALAKCSGVNKTLPRYHYITSGFNDPIRDGNLLLNKGYPSLLVLDGLTMESSEPKIEKAFDLINTLTCPIVLVCTGNPDQFCSERLHIKPDVTIMLAESKVLEI